MKNNDIIRRLRYIFDVSDSKMISTFASAELKVTRAQISDWLKKEDDPAFQKIDDSQLASFLDGLINLKRGKKSGVQSPPEKRLTNNKIFTKIKIALNLKADDVIELLVLADFKISKSELSAFFRKPGHKHYMECKDQILRLFLKGIELHYHDNIEINSESSADSNSESNGKSTNESDTASYSNSDTGFKWKK